MQHSQARILHTMKPTDYLALIELFVHTRFAPPRAALAELFVAATASLVDCERSHALATRAVFAAPSCPLPPRPMRAVSKPQNRIKASLPASALASAAAAGSANGVAHHNSHQGLANGHAAHAPSNGTATACVVPSIVSANGLFTNSSSSNNNSKPSATAAPAAAAPAAPAAHAQPAAAAHVPEPHTAPSGGAAGTWVMSAVLAGAVAPQQKPLLTPAEALRLLNSMQEFKEVGGCCPPFLSSFHCMQLSTDPLPLAALS